MPLSPIKFYMCGKIYGILATYIHRALIDAGRKFCITYDRYLVGRTIKQRRPGLAGAPESDHLLSVTALVRHAYIRSGIQERQSLLWVGQWLEIMAHDISFNRAGLHIIFWNRFVWIWHVNCVSCITSNRAGLTIFIVVLPEGLWRSHISRRILGCWTLMVPKMPGKWTTCHPMSYLSCKQALSLGLLEARRCRIGLEGGGL